MERLNARKYSHCTEPEVRTEGLEEQERRKSGKWHVATGHAQLRIVNHAYTATCSYNTMLFADPDCCTRTNVCMHFVPVIHVTARELHNCP